MFNHTPRNIGSMAAITPAVKFLLILNIAIFLIEVIFGVPLSKLFALPAKWWSVWSFGNLFTYMFVHANTGHLLMNMMGLYFIGPTVERTLGSYRFFILYYLSGILGGLGWSLLAAPGTGCVGASGAIFGILAAFAVLYPTAEVVLIFLPFFPIKAWKIVLAFACWELIQTVANPIHGHIANAAHLVGGIAGFAYAMAIKHPHLIAELKNKFSASKPSRSQKTAPRNETLSKEEIDRILDKIGKEGMGALSLREREMLKKATRG